MRQSVSAELTYAHSRQDDYGVRSSVITSLGADLHRNLCSFCNDISVDSPSLWNRPLFESLNFVVIPSLGALIEGWLLIVSKTHFICAAAFPDHMVAELESLKSNVCEAVRSRYGNAIVFEHGPASDSRPVGCGVDHAHLHVVPISHDLTAPVLALLPSAAVWQGGDLSACRAAFRSGFDYLYLEQAPHDPKILVWANVGSQLFRRAIASQLGVPEEYNWREHPRRESAVSTAAAFSRLQQFRRP